ncbi:mamu class II histocompatibility antigen, DR alpha chain [Dicentrarchus labrax]|uniref:mamu class II histocompatibility antigen, DR alpha chain n=1 Tax=Dicentrarchus labrax TaxID=13489 RepID=UPI0021F588F1|nr:mamu class II histocompatibility antigen, DR alpha chain [Dicentrarchus labrax]XP_051249911.1 mamu class II histocompatibility antigen, DR alpha chain [Dicentrarchus labrax]
MKMMMMMVLVLWFSCVSADVLHEDIAIDGCSDSDGEVMYGLDGEEKWVADFINKKGVEPQPNFIDHMSYVEGTYENAVANQQICRQNLKVALQAYKNPPLQLDPPSSPMIYTRDNVELGEKNTLICHVTGFYPAPVKVYWTKNGKNVTEGTSINVPYLNTDTTFTQTSRLEFIPQLGDMYSCSVKHLSLKDPLTRFWDVEKPEPSIGPAVC